jgi:uracil-DNA glycosylase family 4
MGEGRGHRGTELQIGGDPGVLVVPHPGGRLFRFVVKGRKELLVQLDRVVKDCHGCRLWRTATNAVPGEGGFKAEVMFVGEAPGYHEDRSGRPFVGRAGRLLDKLLAKVGLRREEVYITNVVKHRPPENRAPNKDEVRACFPYLQRQIQVINPKVIVPLGRFALEAFVKDQQISKVHGQPFKVGERIILPLYHPAAALRSRAVQHDLEKDFSKLPKVLKGEIKPRVIKAKNGNENQLELFG